MAELTPSIDYMAKDYESFRQLMLDRLSATLPAWKERHAPDLGVAIVEALAYVADHLSYYQDAIATEAYLGTARQRISVRRHARLLDYVLHEGCNACAWIQCQVDGPTKAVTIAELQHRIFVAAPKHLAAEVLEDGDVSAMSGGGHEVFRLVGNGSATFHSSLNSMTVAGALEERGTEAVIELNEGVVPEEGSVLILTAPVPGPNGPIHVFHPVALTEIVVNSDATQARIRWHFDDAIPAELARLAPIRALGNIVLVDHGRWVSDTFTFAGDKTDPVAAHSKARQASIGPLTRRNLTHRTPVAPATATASAAARTATEAARAVPAIELIVDGQSQGQVRPDLLESRPSDRHFCVEVDDHGDAWLRFGDWHVFDGNNKSVTVKYRTGNGASGNVPAGAINRLVPGEEGLTIHNPMPAAGGTEPESTAAARLKAPGAMRLHQERAVSAEDYAMFARAIAGVANASAMLSDEGARKIVRVAIDPAGYQSSGTDSDRRYWTGLRQRVQERLEGVRRINHEVMVTLATYVKLDIHIKLNVLPGYVSEDVGLLARWRLVGSDEVAGRTAFFGPDSLTFGQAIHWSHLASCLHAIPGVASVERLRFIRKDRPDSADPDVIAIGQGEIASQFQEDSEDIMLIVAPSSESAVS